MLVIYAMIGGLVALAIALYYNAQQKATRLSQLHKELRRVTEELESTQQQLKIKEKLYEGIFIINPPRNLYLTTLCPRLIRFSTMQVRRHPSCPPGPLKQADLAAMNLR
jgi:hypothetical protein